MSEPERALLLKQYPSSKSSKPMCALELPPSRHNTPALRPQAELIQVNVLRIRVHACSERPRQSCANNHRPGLRALPAIVTTTARANPPLVADMEAGDGRRQAARQRPSSTVTIASRRAHRAITTSSAPASRASPTAGTRKHHRRQPSRASRLDLGQNRAASAGR
jgi:hypothetical protein